MNELEFINSIDCRFPYFDELEWKRLIKVGASISPNSAFMVLHEICRPGRSVNAAPEQLLTIAKHWLDEFHHPLAERLFSVASRCIKGECLSIPEALDLFYEIRHYQDQYNALAIVYFSCDDSDGRIESEYGQIIQQWRAA